MEKSLLASYAHPDDEAFGNGGTISRYAAQGVRIDLICATRGEVGEIAENTSAKPETLGAVRENELRCAADAMGIHEVIFLGHRDSGMKDATTNKDPRAFINIPDVEVVSQLVGAIRRLRPLIVVTFEPYGGYGHPDHIAIHKHTVNAFHAAGDPRLYPELGPAWQSKRLFYTVIPHTFLEKMRTQMVALGMDTDEIDQFDDLATRWPDEKINVAIDVSSTVEDKWDGLNCHQTQFGPGNLFHRLPEETVKELLGVEYYSLAWPEPEPGLVMMDLFEGL